MTMSALLGAKTQSYPSAAK
jgi:hypothetical protein